jgi:2-dehydropantoate 2-reductase
MVKVLIFGTGGVGCIYAYVCEKGGADVTAVCRSNYKVVKEHGITIASQIWGTVTFQPRVVRSVFEAAKYGVFDFIIVCSKAFPGTAALIRDAVSARTAIVLAQNGIAIEDEYASLYPNSTIISGSVYLPTTQTRPGYCVHGPLELFEIGTYPASASAEAKAKAQQLSDIFKAGGASAPVFDDIQERRWIKLAVNAAWNPATALSLCDDANFLRSSPDADSMIVKIFQEVGTIAAAAGYPGLVTAEEIERQMQRSRHRKISGGKEPSMLVDVKNDRSMEVEAILGNTVRIARKLSVEAKYLDLLYVLAKARNFQINPGDQWVPLAM